MVSAVGYSPPAGNAVTLSFTGTWRGMTASQQELLRELLLELRPTLFVHGACIGADDEADRIAVSLGIPREVYPSDREDKRVPDAVLLARSPALTLHAAVPPLARNPFIVRRGDTLAAAPRQPREITRSGTWTTVRLARKAGRPVYLLLP